MYVIIFKFRQMQEADLKKSKRKFSRLRAIEIEQIKPTMEIPQPKKINEQQRKKKRQQYYELKKSEIIENEELRYQQQEKKYKVQRDFDRMKSQFQASEIKSHKDDLESLEILSFVLGELSGQNQEFTVGRIYKKWQAMEIVKNNYDTNIGDFIIKFPNPDFLPKQIDDTEMNSKISSIKLKSALHFYSKICNSSDITDKKKRSRQQNVFVIAFFLIGFKNLELNISEHIQREVMLFNKKYHYYCEILEIPYESYLQKLKQQKFLKIQNQLRDFIQLIKNKINKNQFDMLKNFQLFKEEFLRQLNKELNLIDPNNIKQSIRYSQYSDILKNQLVLGILKSCDHYCKLFRTFPRLFNIIVQNLKNKQDVKKIQRKLYRGGTLQKINKSGSLTWVLKHRSPQDVLTLIRKFIMYKLTRIGGLFTRTFLASDEQYFFIVVKASEQHLEKEAQNQNFSMQLQFGSTDLFSFEPVDQYFRPLRISKYIREEEFKKKYNLQSNKQDKDQNIGEKSIQSEALNLYKKADKMNSDQLRAKIILDQEQCDKKYQWVSKILSIKYIIGDQKLQNEHNTQKINPNVWPVYYVYNKLIIEGIHRIEQVVNSKNDHSQTVKAFKNNIGLFLRLLFLKSQYVANMLYYEHRKTSLMTIKNYVFRQKYQMKLKNIWNRMGENTPRGYWPYFYSGKLDRIWKKHEISENKDRSKFTPASRTIIIDRIINSQINISEAKQEGIVKEYYPIHDPYILKNIRLQPYLNVLDRLVSKQDARKVEEQQFAKSSMKNMFIQYECKYTNEDFTNDSVYEKLSFNLSHINEFSVNTVAYYCGEKLAFYFQFRRFMTQRVCPFIIGTFIFQILLWVERTHVLQNGSSSLTDFNNVLMIIMAVFNIIWVDRTIFKWKQRQQSLARAFGTTQIKQSHKKRVLFRGQYYRNIQTDQMNYEKVGPAHNIIKEIIALVINLAYVIFIGSIILYFIVLGGELSQLGYNEFVLHYIIPAGIIAIIIKLSDLLIYPIILKIIVNFENHRTIHSYESSLSSKNYLITFVVTYFANIVYSFFSVYFDTDDVCSITTSSGQKKQDCFLYLSGQLISNAMLTFFLTIILAFQPYLLFRYRNYKENKAKRLDITFNGNPFQSFDNFYEQQDKMDSFMYSDQIDKTWYQLTTAIILFTTLSLFGPIVPFLYPVIYFTSLISLHSQKYQIIYLSQRTIPAKANSIGENWLRIMEIVSVIGIFFNFALIVYVRNVFSGSKSTIFLSICFPILVIKYLLSFISFKQDLVGQRCKIKARNLVTERDFFYFDSDNKNLYTDIENVFYNEKNLQRRLPRLHPAKVKHKKQKTE